MIYREKMISLLESLDTKINVIDSVSRGVMQLPQQEVNTLIEQIKTISNTLQNLVSNER